MPARVLAIVAAFLFSSGLCALVYQAVWLRAFRVIFGASTPSTAAVLAIFMGGLGLGGALLGRRVERARYPLVTYGNLEIGVALSAALTPFLLDAARFLYGAIGGTPAIGPVGATFARLVLSILVLGVPVFLMGGTLPAAARVVTMSGDGQRRALATLYGINTLGAVAGSLLATFALLEIYGARMTLWIACLLNLVIGVIARGRGRAFERLPHIDEGVSARMRPRRVPVLVAAFLTGFVFLLSELVWYRMAAPVLGGSTYGFGLVLACALFGMGVGGALYAAAPPRTPSALAFAVTCALEALFLLVPFAIGDDLALLAHHLRAWGMWSFPLLSVGWAIVTALIVMPASLVAGYQFPLLLALKGSADVEVGRDSGEVYAANTLGSIVGSLAGGFGVLPMLGAPGAWRFAALTLTALALAALLAGRRELRTHTLAASASVGVLVLALWLASAAGPGALWRHTAIGAGRAVVEAETRNDRIRIERELARAILRDEDGVESSLAFQGGEAWSLVQNGKSDGNTYADAPTQVGLALLPAVLADNVRQAFVIGLGTGQSAGWLAQVSSIERVDVAEIEPGVNEFAKLCADTNYHVMENPKVHVQIGDGRELLALSQTRYDLIVSEPSNPYRAGVSSFFSRELYRAAADRLTPTGVFSQWVQGYEIDVAGIEVVAATMATAFSHVSVWEVGTRDLLFLGSNAPQVIDVDRMRARLAQLPFSRWARHIVGVDSAEGVLALHLAGTATLSALAQANAASIHTDDLPILEFSFARSVGQVRAPAREIVASAARARGDDRAAVRGAVDWERVAREGSRMHVWASQGDGSSIPPPLSMALRMYVDGRPEPARAAFLTSAHPLDANERVMMADAMSASPGTLEEREQLEVLLTQLEADGFFTDAAWIRVRAAVSDARGAGPQQDAVLDALVERAAALARVDPWPFDRVLRGALKALPQAGASESRVRSLHKPFAGAVADRLRIDIATELDRRLGVRPACVDTLALAEPHTPWRLDALLWRARCYQGVGHSLALHADAELEDFIAHEARERLQFGDASPAGTP